MPRGIRVGGPHTVTFAPIRRRARMFERATAQRGDLLDLSAGDFGERLGAVENPLDPAAVEILDRDQVPDPCRGHAASDVRSPTGTIATSSDPSTSSTRTLMRCCSEVGM